MTNKLITGLLLLLSISQPTYSRAIPNECGISVAGSHPEAVTNSLKPFYWEQHQYDQCLHLSKRVAPSPVRGGGGKGSGSKPGAKPDADNPQAIGKDQDYGSDQGFGSVRDPDPVAAPPAAPPPAVAPARPAPATGGGAVPPGIVNIETLGYTRTVTSQSGSAARYIQNLVKDPANNNAFKGFEVNFNPPGKNPVLTSWYSINSREGIYVIELAEFRQEGIVHPIRHRQMVVSNYQAEAGSLSSMRYLVLDTVVNDEARASVTAALLARGKSSNSDNIEKFEPGSLGWNELVNNALIGGQLPMVSENAALFGTTRIKSITTQTTKSSIDPTKYPLKVITELGPV